mgnify:CR=1 FL=1
MKLLDALYSIVSDSPMENGHDFELRLNPEHFIYQAHFPGEPITPGVCIMQIAVELLEAAMKTPLALTCVKNIKFLKIISPKELAQVSYSLQKITKEEGEVKAQVVVSAGNDIYAKLSLVCKEI